MKGEIFKQIRQALGLTQARLAARLGVSERTLQYWESTGEIPRMIRAVMWIELDRGGILDLFDEYENGPPENKPAVEGRDWQAPAVLKPELRGDVAGHRPRRK